MSAERAAWGAPARRRRGDWPEDAGPRASWSLSARACGTIPRGGSPTSAKRGVSGSCGMIQHETILAYALRLADEFRPRRIILFGSHAYGRPHQGSDVDLLVVMPFRGHAFDFATEMLRRVRPPFAVDLVVHRPADATRRYRQFDPLVREALDHGKVLYERHGARMAQPRRGQLSLSRPHRDSKTCGRGRRDLPPTAHKAAGSAVARHLNRPGGADRSTTAQTTPRTRRGGCPPRSARGCRPVASIARLEWPVR